MISLYESLKGQDIQGSGRVYCLHPEAPKRVRVSAHLVSQMGSCQN